MTEAELLASLRPLRLRVDYVAPGLADLSVVFCLGLLAGGVLFAAVFSFLRHRVVHTDSANAATTSHWL